MIGPASPSRPPAERWGIGYAWAPHLVTPLCVWRAPRGAGRRIALTFDDGPDPEFTPRVLDLLAARGIRASFFLVGERAARAPATVRAIAEAGHEIGSHGWSHRSLWLCGPARTDAEIGRARAILGELPARPPCFALRGHGDRRISARSYDRAAGCLVDPPRLAPAPADVPSRAAPPRASGGDRRLARPDGPAGSLRLCARCRR